jgi:trehalose/maltose hydrolase-like predicted phosphorylase
MRTGWDGLLAGQRAYLDDVWARADIEVEGDPELQQALRFALFRVPPPGREPGRCDLGAAVGSKHTGGLT